MTSLFLDWLLWTYFNFLFWHFQLYSPEHEASFWSHIFLLKHALNHKLLRCDLCHGEKHVSVLLLAWWAHLFIFQLHYNIWQRTIFQNVGEMKHFGNFRTTQIEWLWALCWLADSIRPKVMGDVIHLRTDLTFQIRYPPLAVLHAREFLNAKSKE